MIILNSINMKRFSLYFSLLILVISQLSAQNDYNGFDLSKYYTPDIKRNSLEFQFNMNGSATNYRDTTTASSFNLQDTQLSFSSLINTRRKISTFQTGINVGLGYSKFTDKNFSFSNSDYVRWFNKLYYSGKHFFIYNATVNYYGNYAKITKTQIPDITTYKTSEVNVIPEIGWGIGRIERVEDARQAIYILEEFKRNNVLNREMDKEEIFEFAQLISTVKNKRFLDSRLHRIDEISTLDNYLKNKGVLSNVDAPYFTSLYDMWDYGALFNRSSGLELSFKVSPTYYCKAYYETNNDFQTKYFGVISSASFNYSKPVKLNWQHDFSAKANFGIYDIIPGYNDAELYYIPSAELSYQLNYYPTTRTNLYAETRYNFNSQQSSDVTSKYLSQQFLLGAGANYYVSQNVRLSGYAGINSKMNKVNDFFYGENNSYIYFNFSLKYMFF